MKGFIEFELNEKHLELIPHLFLNELDEGEYSIKRDYLFGGDIAIEEIAKILGYYDKACPNTYECAEGPSFSEELTNEMIEYYNFFKENLYYIMLMILQYSTKGGIKIGKYRARRDDLIFEYLG